MFHVAWLLINRGDMNISDIWRNGCIFKTFADTTHQQWRVTSKTITNVRLCLLFQIPNLLLQLPQATSEGNTGSNRQQPALSCVHQQRLLLEAQARVEESLGNGKLSFAVWKFNFLSLLLWIPLGSINGILTWLWNFKGIDDLSRRDDIFFQWMLFIIWVGAREGQCCCVSVRLSMLLTSLSWHLR